MSFAVTLQRNYSEEIRMKKYTENLVETNGVLREGTSILNPEIIFTGLNIENLTSCNYMTIPVFNRSYFVTDIQSLPANAILIRGRCDVLTTYAGYIKDCYAIIKKQENQYNLYLDDGTIKSYNNPVITTVPFPTGINSDNIILITQGA